jgi:hypothetical protein
VNTVSQRLYDAVWSFDADDKKAVAAIKVALAAGADAMAEDVNGRPIALPLRALTARFRSSCCSTMASRSTCGAEMERCCIGRRRSDASTTSSCC